MTCYFYIFPILFNDLYELYITTDEEIKGEAQFGISNDLGEMIFGYTPEQILPCTDVNNDELCDEFDYYNAFTYAGEFDSERVFKYQLNAFDILGNAGISNFLLTYSYLIPGNFRLLESPMKSAELVIFDYSLSRPSSLIITESLIEYDNISIMGTTGMTLHSDDCHYPFVNGYETFAVRIFKPLMRDLYGYTYNEEIDAPMILSANLSDSQTLVIQTDSDNLTTNTNNNSS